MCACACVCVCHCAHSQVVICHPYVECGPWRIDLDEHIRTYIAESITRLVAVHFGYVGLHQLCTKTASHLLTSC